MTSEVTTKLGRVQLVNGTPPMSPAKCVICGTSGDSESKFIDTGWDIDFYGVVYFCLNCIREAAAVLSMIPAEKYDYLLDSHNELDYKYIGLVAENERLRNVISDLRSIGFNSSDSQSNSHSSEPVGDASAKESEPASRKSVAAKSRSTKQTHESGSTNVRINDSTKGAADELNL